MGLLLQVHFHSEHILLSPHAIPTKAQVQPAVLCPALSIQLPSCSSATLCVPWAFCLGIMWHVLKHSGTISTFCGLFFLLLVLLSPLSSVQKWQAFRSRIFPGQMMPSITSAACSGSGCLSEIALSKLLSAGVAVTTLHSQQGQELPEGKSSTSNQKWEALSTLHPCTATGGTPVLSLFAGWVAAEGKHCLFAAHPSAVSGSSASEQQCGFTGNRGGGFIYTPVE